MKADFAGLEPASQQQVHGSVQVLPLDPAEAEGPSGSALATRIEQKHVEARIVVRAGDVWCLTVPGVGIDAVHEDDDAASDRGNKPPCEADSV